MTGSQHSRPAVISAAIGLGFLLWVACAYSYLLGVAGMLGTSHMSQLGAHAQPARLVAISVALSVLAFVVGLIIGVIGLRTESAKKSLAIVGVVTNTLGVVVVVGMNLFIRAAQQP